MIKKFLILLVAVILIALPLILFKNSEKKEIPEVEKKETVVSEVTPTKKPEKPPQFVILSFDGSESIAMWEATRKFSKEMKQENKPVGFTYFVSGVYFLSDKNKNEYQGPGQKPGVSKIGFSRTEAEIPKRIEEMNLAVSEGSEIASHLNGHFDGSKWSEVEWRSELNQFAKLVPVKTVGLRTPLLAKNKNLYKVLGELGYEYDASAVGKMSDWPKKDENGIWEIPLVSLVIPGINKSSLSMDYNIFLAQTGGKDILKRGTPQWNTALSQVNSAYQNYFQNCY